MAVTKDKIKIFITGGAGFIGSNFIISQLLNTDNEILNLDKLTYASSLKSLERIENNSILENGNETVDLTN